LLVYPAIWYGFRTGIIKYMNSRGLFGVRVRKNKSWGSVTLPVAVLGLLLAGCGGNDSGVQQSATGISTVTSNETALQTDTTASRNSTGTGTGSFTLYWTAPTRRVDGTPLSLSQINGYYVYIGQSRGHYTMLIEVTDGSSNSITLTDIAPGRYYVVMTTYDVNGLESGYSEEITKAAI